MAREAKWDGVVALMKNISEAVEDAILERRNVKFNCPPMVALLINDALTFWMDNRAPLYRAQVEIENNMVEAAQIAQEAMQDAAARFVMATTDLEMLLHDFIGRPPATMEEVRKRRSEIEQRSAGHFTKRGGIPVSDALRKSIAKGSIGLPREPGEEG